MDLVVADKVCSFMAERLPSLLQLPIALGEHAGVWTLDEERVQGSVELLARRSPELRLHLEHGSGAGGYPRNHRNLPNLCGRLYSNVEVMLGDVDIEEWWTGEIIGSARWALAGLNVCKVQSDGWRRADIQVSGLEALAVHPIRATAHSHEGRARPQMMSAEIDPDVQVSRAAGIAIDCHYWRSTSFADPYEFRVLTALVVAFKSPNGQSVDDWVGEWVTPLVSLVSLATGRRERLRWMEVGSTLQSDDRESVKGQLFGTGIDQERAAAARQTGPDGRPLTALFTLADAPPLADLIRRWSVVKEEHAALTLQSLAANEELPEIARYLLAVNGLESLHATLNSGKERAQDVRHAAKLEKVLTAIHESRLPRDVITFVKKHLHRTPRRSLAHRIDETIRKMPGARGLIETWEKRTAALGSELEARNYKRTDKLAERLASTRNLLSHGGVLPHEALEPAVEIVQTISRCEVLRLLDFTDEQIAHAFARVTT